MGKVIQRNFRKFQTLRSWGWFIIIQKTRPLIGQINLEEELRLLEEKAKDSYGVYKEQLDTKARLEAENVAMEEEKKASAMKADLEVQLVDAGKKLTAMEASRQQATLDKKALEGDNVVIKKDIEDLELAIQKLEQEKTNRDHTIRALNDEIANQDEVLN